MSRTRWLPDVCQKKLVTGECALSIMVLTRSVTSRDLFSVANKPFAAELLDRSPKRQARQIVLFTHTQNHMNQIGHHIYVVSSSDVTDTDSELSLLEAR